MQRRWMTQNRAEHWRRALTDNLTLQGDTLKLTAPGIATGVAYLSAIDSGQKDFVWRRACVSANVPGGALRVSAYASNALGLEGHPDLNGYLTDPNLSFAHKQAALDPLYAPCPDGAQDVLLAAAGRYLWLKIDMIATKGKAELSSVRVQTEGDHMLDHLPALYAQQDDGFLWRFLSIFDSFFTDLEERVDGAAALFDLDAAQGEMLEMLACWVMVDGRDMEAQPLRAAIRAAVSTHGRMQTPEGLRRQIERMTGRRPILVEQFQVAPMLRAGRDKEAYVRLFGDAPWQLSVLLVEEAFASRQEARAFQERLSALAPAHVRARLVLLRQGVFLGWHTYLGVNTALIARSGAALDEYAAIHYDTMIGGRQA